MNGNQQLSRISGKPHGNKNLKTVAHILNWSANTSVCSFNHSIHILFLLFLLFCSCQTKFSCSSFLIFLPQISWFQWTGTGEVSEQNQRHHSQTLAAALQPRPGWAYSRGLCEPPQQKINDPVPRHSLAAKAPESSTVYSPAVVWSNLSRAFLSWLLQPVFPHIYEVKCCKQSVLLWPFKMCFRSSGRIMWRTSASWRSWMTLLTMLPSSVMSLRSNR